MTSTHDLIKAIRTGRLSVVNAALNSSAAAELNDGLPLAMACFLGHAEIVRELLIRGAKVNFDDNTGTNSPLAMAVRAGKTEVVKVLVEYGAVIPEGMETGLRPDELMLARWKAQQAGVAEADENFEEIKVGGCYGTDTDILDEDMRRAVESFTPKTQKTSKS